MESLVIEPTDTSPRINFNCEKLIRGKYIFEITGESRPENVTGFYNPVLNWLSQYESYLNTLHKTGTVNKRKIRVKFKLQYFNSSSAKYLLDVLTVFSRIHNKKAVADIKVIWIYDPNDEDMLDSGKEFSKMTNIPFSFAELKPGEDAED